VKTIKIIPEICKGEAAKWSGFVVLKMPSFDERYELFENLNIKVGEDGQAEVSKNDGIKTMRDMVKMSKKLYVELELKHVDGEEIKSFDDMQYCEDLHPVMIEVASKMMHGFKVGNG
tara:strand:- start:7 stop:357 length:351 start_codon:yes stop_codon:yes gene_type:complete